MRDDAGQAQSELTLRLLTLAREGRGKRDEASAITDENQTALPDWEGVKHDFVLGDWSQRRVALAHGVSVNGVWHGPEARLSLAWASFARSFTGC